MFLLYIKFNSNLFYYFKVDGESLFLRPSEHQSTSQQKLAHKRKTIENEETKRTRLLDMACMTL